MIEEFVRVGVGTLLAQGTGWVVAVILGIWAYILDGRVRQTEDIVREQYERRLEEFKVVLDAMAGSTNATKAMDRSVTATTEAINQLASGFAKLLNEFNSHKERWADHGTQMAKQMEDVRNRIESLQRHTTQRKIGGGR